MDNNKIMKNLKRSVLILILLIILAYVTNITAMPYRIILFEGEKLNLQTIFGVEISELAMPVGAGIDSSDAIQTTTVQLSLFNVIPIKEIEVNKLPVTTVIPLGNTVRS